MERWVSAAWGVNESLWTWTAEDKHGRPSDTEEVKGLQKEGGEEEWKKQEQERNDQTLKEATALHHEEDLQLPTPIPDNSDATTVPVDKTVAVPAAAPARAPAQSVGQVVVSPWLPPVQSVRSISTAPQHKQQQTMSGQQREAQILADKVVAQQLQEKEVTIISHTHAVSK